MAPASRYGSNKDDVIGQDPGTENTHNREQIKEESKKMTFIQKLMLTAQLWGMEAACNLEHLYTVPILQTLGMPLSLVSLTGLISGPSSMMLLPLSGWLTDRGSNPQQRKAVAIVFASLVITLGLSCIVTANVLHQNYLLDYDARKNIVSNTSHSWTKPTQTEPAPVISFTTYMILVEGFENETDTGIYTNTNSFLSTERQHSTTTPSHSVITMDSASGVPFKAGLGMLGFILLDLGYDLSNSYTRSYVLTCSHRSEHTSMLVLGIIMASAGGVTTAFLGIVDLPSLLGITSVEGASIVLQTSIQALAVIFFVVFGTLITLLAGRRQLKRNVQYKALMSIKPNQNSSTASLLHEDQLTNSSQVNLLESSAQGFRGGAGVHLNSCPALLHEDHALPSEQTPLLAEDGCLKNKTDFVGTHNFTSSISYYTDDPIFNHSEQSTIVRESLEEVSEEKLLHTSEENVGCSKPCNAFGFKTKIAFVCIANYFSNCVVMYYTMTSSDLIGKAIYGGDPDAAPGSESLARYQEGLRMASRGFLVYYGTYLLISFVHPRLLAFLGHRVEYVLVHLMMASAMLLLALTVRLETYFFLTVVAGLQRACFAVVPYAAANDIMNNVDKDGKKNVGLAMSLVTFSVPLGYCTLFSWIGSLEDFTGMVTIPMWLGAGFACLSTTAFLCIGKV